MYKTLSMRAKDRCSPVRFDYIMHPHGHGHHYYYPNASGPAAPAHHHQPPQYAMNNNALLSSAEESNIFGFLDAFDWDVDESVGAGMPAFEPGTMAPVAAGPETPMDVDPYYAHPFGGIHPSPPPPPPPLSLRMSPDDAGLLPNAPTPCRTPNRLGLVCPNLRNG
ncbi:hypothetical protein RSAG8_03183, partial [Rhizoctonia solani AG-8 WAC10335]